RQNEKAQVLARSSKKKLRQNGKPPPKKKGRSPPTSQRSPSPPSPSRLYKKPRTSPRQYLLPRHPITLREHRAKALVPLNNVTKRSFQSQNVQLTAKPYRQRDRVVRTPSFQPIQKPQPKLRIRQRQFRRPLNRTQRRSRDLPAPNRFTSAQTVAASNRLRIETSTSKLERMRLIRRVASSECPPSAKKSSSIPTRSTPNTSANSPQRISSCGVRGKPPPNPPTCCGAGSAPRSSFPFAVSGRRSSSTIAPGTM